MADLPKTLEEFEKEINDLIDKEKFREASRLYVDFGDKGKLPKNDETKALFERMIGRVNYIESDDLELVRFQGLTHRYHRHFKEALEFFEHFIQKKQDDPWIYNNRGNTYDELEEYSKAISDYGKAIALKPNYHQAYNNRGIAHRQLREYHKAIDDYDKAIELEPSTSAPFNNRGVIHTYLKNMRWLSMISVMH